MTTNERRSAETGREIREAANRLAGRGVATVTVAAVAREAGVSVRTVYRYFPTRAELLEAAVHGPARRYPELGAPRTASELVYRLPRAYGEMDATPARLGDVEAGARDGHRNTVAAAIGVELQRMAPRERMVVSAAVTAMTSGRGFEALRDEAGLDGPEAARAVAWVVARLLEGRDG